MAVTLSNVVVRTQIQMAVAAGRLSGNLNHQPAEGNPTIGTGTGQVSKVYSADFTVDTGTPLSLDLTTILDPSGVAFNPSKVTHILIENSSIVAGQDFTVGGGTNGLFAALTTLVRAAGGQLLIADPGAGITVDGTHKILTIAVAAGTGVAGKITIVGR